MWQFLEWLRSHGLNESTATAGLLGGTVRGLIIRGGWVNGIVSALVGAITANYLGTAIAISPTVNPWNWSEGTVGFVVGMSAMLGWEVFSKKAADYLNSFRFPGQRP